MGSQPPVSPRFRQRNRNDGKEAETYLAPKDTQRKFKENILLISAKGGWPAHEYNTLTSLHCKYWKGFGTKTVIK